MIQINQLKNEGKSPKAKKYSVKNNRTKSQGAELEAKTKFKGRCSDLEGYIFGLGLRSSDNFIRKMKDLEHYFGETYSDSCQQTIMTETPATFSNP